MCIQRKRLHEKVLWILKIGLSPFKETCFICFNESLLKMMKNALDLILKTLFVLKSFKSFSWIFRHVARKNGLIRKLRLISKLMTTQHRYQSVTIQILPNISRSKGNETMEFGQLIDYDKRNNFFSKIIQKWGKVTSSRPLFVF